MSRPGQQHSTEEPVLSDISLPAKRVSPWVVETSPEAAQAWIESLPLVDSAQVAQQLYQSLYTLNRMDLPVEDRLMLMELYRNPVASAANGLQHHFAHFSLPLRPRQKQLSDFLVQLYMEMAYGYKHVLRAALSGRKPWEDEGFLVTLERAIRYLGEVLLRCYQVYMPFPPGVWKEIHGLYHYAERHGQALTRLPDDSSIVRAYLQTLMLGLCGPYQLPQNECHQVNAFLARWAHKVEISPRVGGIDPVGYFLLDLAADHPALPFPQDVSLRQSPTLRAVNAIELARVVHGFIARLQKGEPARQLDLGFECIGPQCTDTLKRMLRFWGLAGRRHFSRRRLRQPLSLCVGLNAVHFFMSGQQSFSPPHAATAVPENEALAPNRFMLDPESLKSESTPAVADETPATEVFRVDSRWQVRDESAGGLSLVRSGDVGLPMRIGDVLGIQNAAGSDWRIGVVRWVKSPDTRNVEVGVEMLAPHAQPLAVRPADSKDVPYSQALLLPPIEAMHQPTTLLVPRGFCRTGQDMDVAEGDMPPRRVRVLNIVERTNAFAQVVFADVVRE